MKDGINKTLLESLFTNPKPLSRRYNLYINLKDRIFPKCDEYINFLSTNDIDEKIELAKSILNRLCFHSNFPPPYQLFINLIDYENDDINKSKSSTYIPQDHLVHIVNSYMLGIYVFFYHRIFNRDLTKEFIYKRKECELDPVLNATKDFVSSWKYFCLYHDLAYPIESLYKIDESKKILSVDKNKIKYIDPYNKIVTMQINDWVLKGLARLITIYELINDPANRTIDIIFNKNLYKTYILQDGNITIDNNDIIAKYSDFICIDKICTSEHLKLLSGFVEESNIIQVLFDAYSEIPVAFKINEDNKAYYYLLNSSFGTNVGSKALEYLKNDDLIIDDKYKTRYLLNDPKKLFDYVFDIKIDGNNVVKIINEAIKKKENPALKSNTIDFYHITSRLELDNYIYQHYTTLNSFKNDIYGKDYKISIQKALNGIININNSTRIYNKYLNNYLFYIISDAFRNIIEKDKKNVDKLVSKLTDNSTGKPYDEVKKLVSNYIDNSLNEVNINKIKDEVISQIMKNIEEQINNEINESNAIALAMTKISVIFIKNTEIILAKENSFNMEFILDKCEANDFIKEVTDEIRTKINELRNVDIKEIVNKYNTEFSVFDHGIVGSLLFLYNCFVSNNSIKLLMNSKKEFTKAMRSMCWQVNNDEFDSKLVNNYRHVFLSTFDAIFSHNIYPADFQSNLSKKWMTYINQSSFTYFCMLIDSLQRWNRKKYHEHSINWLPLFSNDQYDISIKDDQLIISLISYTKDFEAIKKRVVDDLNQYLKDCSNYISIEIKGTY